MTPLDALDPYMAAEAASLSAVTRAMSLGLMRSRGSDTPGMLLLLSGTPSTTMRGSLLPLRDASPRMRMVLPDPGCPDLEVTVTPDILPAISWSGEVMAPFWKSLASTLAMDPVRSFLLWEP